MVLYLAIWVDKSPLNSSMTRKATPVMMFIMNDKTRTPFRIGFAPDDFGSNADFLEALLAKEAKCIKGCWSPDRCSQGYIEYID